MKYVNIKLEDVASGKWNKEMFDNPSVTLVQIHVCYSST